MQTGKWVAIITTICYFFPRIIYKLYPLYSPNYFPIWASKSPPVDLKTLKHRARMANCRRYTGKTLPRSKVQLNISRSTRWRGPTRLSTPRNFSDNGFFNTILQQLTLRNLGRIATNFQESALARHANAETSNFLVQFTLDPLFR